MVPVTTELNSLAVSRWTPEALSESIAMKLRVILGGTIARVSAAVLAGRSGADAEKTPTIKDLMVKLHKGAKSPLAQLQGELKAEDPAWEKNLDRTRDLVISGAAVAKNEPPRGDLGSWKELSDMYFQDAKALDDAAQAHDRAAAEAARSRGSRPRARRATRPTGKLDARRARCPAGTSTPRGPAPRRLNSASSPLYKDSSRERAVSFAGLPDPARRMK